MNARSQRRLRQAHRWLSLFFAPSILFFAATGVLQSLGLQDRADGYQPPHWLSVAASVHKHGRLPQTRPERAPAAKPKDTRARAALPGVAAFSLFAALLGVALAFAALLGIWIALLQRHGRRLAVGILALGAAVPIALLLV